MTLAVLQDPLHGGPAQTLPVGDAVSAALLLTREARVRGWAIVATAAALRPIAGAVRTGARDLVRLRGRGGPLDVMQVVGLAQ